MKTKHTKGQWTQEIDHSRKAGNYPNTLIGANGKRIAVCYNRQDFSISQEEAEANAKLIAAAPDMLESLKDVYDRLDNMTESGRYAMGLHNIYDSVTSAINKATI